jgi:hypothetical protein
MSFLSYEQEVNNWNKTHINLDTSLNHFLTSIDKQKNRKKEDYFTYYNNMCIFLQEEGHELCETCSNLHNHGWIILEDIMNKYCE